MLCIRPFVVCYNITMHRNVIFTFSLLIYFVVVATGLNVFDVSIFTAAAILLGVPVYFLGRFSAAPPAMIATITGFAAGLALILEGAAHIYGLWFIEGVPALRLFSIVPVEIIFVTILKVLFLVLLYELLFDDGFYSERKARLRFVEFGVFALGAVVLLGIHKYLFSSMSYPTAYYWIVVTLLTSSVAMLSLKQTLTLRLFKKIAVFVAVAALPLLCFEVLSVANGYKTILTAIHPVMIPFAGVSIPLGEILLAFSIPGFIATVYELYLDDRM